MRIVLFSAIFIVAASVEASAWRCMDPDRPKCPGGLCVHDLKLKSDYCVRGIVTLDTAQGKSITVTSPASSAGIRKLKND